MLRILVRGSLEMLLRMFEIMYIMGVRLWEEKVLVMKGLYVWVYIFCSDVIK